jgi:hypothetical protein
MATRFIYFDVMLTDPVQLWSPKDKASRMNKAYFETHVRPFCRTTQLTVKPVNQSQWLHDKIETRAAVNYGPALRLVALCLLASVDTTKASFFLEHFQACVGNLRSRYLNTDTTLILVETDIREYNRILIYNMRTPPPPPLPFCALFLSSKY